MAGLLKDWLGENPFYQGMDARRNSISQFGLGLMTGTDFQDGLSRGVAGAMGGRNQDDAYAAEQKKQADRQGAINATTEWLRGKAASDPFAADMIGLVDAGAITPNDAFSQVAKMTTTGTSDWSKLNDGTLYNQRTGETMAVGGAGGMSQTEYGLTPIWGKLPDGTFGYGVQGKDGTFKPVDTGDLAPLDPRSLAGERAYGSEIGSAGGKASAAAQGDLDSGLAALDVLDQIKTSPELRFATGTSAGLGGNKIPGTGRYDFQNLVDQAKNGAFLVAVQEMRGLGALSNSEGGAATSAITRMDTATSTEAFMKALADYEAIISRGVEKARARLAANGAAPSVAPQGAPATDYRTKYGLD